MINWFRPRRKNIKAWLKNLEGRIEKMESTAKNLNEDIHTIADVGDQQHYRILDYLGLKYRIEKPKYSDGREGKESRPILIKKE